MMIIEAIGLSVPAEGASSSIGMQPAGGAAPMDFLAVVNRGLHAADDALKAADQSVRTLAAGQEVAPHDVMISLEEARMHLMLLTEVRNRVVEAYQELVRMQL